MKTFAWVVLGMSMAVLVGSCTGIAIHETTRAVAECDAPWVVEEINPFCFEVITNER